MNNLFSAVVFVILSRKFIFWNAILCVCVFESETENASMCMLLCISTGINSAPNRCAFSAERNGRISYCALGTVNFLTGNHLKCLQEGTSCSDYNGRWRSTIAFPPTKECLLRFGSTPKMENRNRFVCSSIRMSVGAGGMGSSTECTPTIHFEPLKMKLMMLLNNFERMSCIATVHIEIYVSINANNKSNQVYKSYKMHSKSMIIHFLHETFGQWF